MPELSRFYGIIIRMFYDDHPPPHFHAAYEGEQAQISIETLEVIEGSKKAMVRVVDVKPLEDARLWVRFSDGVEGVFAVKPERRRGVFEKLVDPFIFNQVTIDEDFGCVEWPGGIDLCPTAMHEEILQDNSAGVRREEALSRA